MRRTAAAALFSSVLAVPSVPPPISANVHGLRQTIATAIKAGDSAFTVAPGEYVFSNSSLIISDARNLVIEAVDAIFIFYYGFGMQIIRGHNVTVRGLTFDSEPPNYAQGKVISLLSETEFIARFDDRFIPPDTAVEPFDSPGGSAGAKVAFWDPTLRRMLFSSNFLNGSTAGIGSAGEWRIPLRQPQLSTQGLQVGSLVTIFPRRGYTWHCVGCSSVAAVNVTIHGGGNMGFLETDGPGGNLYSHVAIRRKPAWDGLMALNADGFHSSDMGVGPTLVDSQISFTGDDFVNVHNRMKVICERLPNGSLAIVDPGGSLATMQRGDQLRFYQLLPGNPQRANPLLGAAEVAAVEAVHADHELIQHCHTVGDAMQQQPYNVHLIGAVASSLHHAAVYRVDFLSQLPDAVTASGYNLVNYEGRSGAGFALRRNHFHDSCGSGGRIIAKGFNGTLVDNVIERFGGIHVYSEQIWLEGALGIRNVHLQNNTIVDARVAQPTSIDVMPGLRNITCVDSTFVVSGTTTKRTSGC